MGASTDHSFRRVYFATLAVIAACGGTTGMENPMGVLGADAASQPDMSIVTGSAMEGGSAADVTIDVTMDVPLDAGAVVDVQGTDLDATVGDRDVRVRPNARDTGAPLVLGDAAVGADAGGGGSGDGGSKDGASVVWSPDGQTTLTILAAASTFWGLDGGRCQACAMMNGCLDMATTGGSCEQGFASGTGELDPRLDCLQTLHDIITSGCGVSTQLTPCLCGLNLEPIVAANCLAGTKTPLGPVYPDYLKSFYPQTRGSDINANFVSPAYGAGVANQIAGCVGSFSCGCLGDTPGP